MSRLPPILVLLVLSCFNFTATAFAAPSIKWEIENRFRYLKRSLDFRNILEAYEAKKAALKRKPSALELEIELERLTLLEKFNGITGGDVRNGWAGSIFLHTCGRQSDHRHASCKMTNGDDYFAPKKGNLILAVDSVSSGMCEWRIDGTTIGTASCTGQFVAKDVEYDKQHHLDVRSGAAQIGALDITMKDALIVSFGDSFSAGEGNPEQPATLTDESYNFYGELSIVDGKPQAFPVREDLNLVPQGDKKRFFGELSASWTNTQCHRSLYSQHAKASLQYALEHPHVSVTFANYSCTGAEVYEGILNAWWARDDVSESNYDDAPQFVKALRDLCNDYDNYKKTEWAPSNNRTESNFNSRSANIAKCANFIPKKIDALLVSIGGNDVGFAQMISNSAVDVPKSGRLNDGREWVYGLWRKASKPRTFSQGLADANRLIPGRYQELSEKLKSYFGLAPYRVILSGYPDVSADEHGTLCKPGNVGMDVHSILGMYGRNTFSQSADFVMKFHDIMKKESTHQGWRFADQHVVQKGAPNNFASDSNGRGHGICARGPSGTLGGQTTFPRPKIPGSTPYRWKPFAPASWEPYSARNRWMVTPNDSFLTTNYHDADMEHVDDPIQPLYAATLSGSFHPNALGHAALADSVLVQLRVVLGSFED